MTYDLNSDQGTHNLLWADALIDGLAAAGVRRAVISPGSRSTPLVLACSRHPEIATWTQVDERSAAFFALGMARHDEKAVILIATSGTAPAHWYPAVIEASQSGAPLILLSADRPPEQQGWAANQTIDQTHLFGGHVRAFHDPGAPSLDGPGFPFIRTLGVRAAHQACSPHPGPVHINLPFREPLVPNEMPPVPERGAAVPVAAPGLQPNPKQIARIHTLVSSRPGLIVCGPLPQDEMFAQTVSALARQLGTPVLADPLSQLRFGGHDRSQIITRYDAFLRRTAFRAAQRPEWVLQFGAPPVSKSLLSYLDECGAPTILVAPRGDWPDPLHQCMEMVRADPTGFCQTLDTTNPKPNSPGWLETFLQEDILAEEMAGEGPLPLEAEIIQQILTQLPADATLFSGNSMPIRQIDSWSGKGETPIRILANRGASGIDGNPSTLLGLAAVSSGPVIGLLGDLALYHDMNGLLAAREETLNGVIVLLNNDGGGIFEYLPQAGLADFEQYWLTPTHLDFEQVARLYGLTYYRTTDAPGFGPALQQALDEPGLSLIEVAVNRKQSVERHHAYRERIIAHDTREI